MRNIFLINLLFFISTEMALSDCAINSCNQESKKIDSTSGQTNVRKIFSSDKNSLIDDIEEQIIASVNSQVSRLNTDLSLTYRKKTLSIRYNMNNHIPEVNSYFSVSYRKRAVNLNYTVAIW